MGGGEGGAGLEYIPPANERLRIILDGYTVLVLLESSGVDFITSPFIFQRT